jgi:hypothetical protein
VLVLVLVLVLVCEPVFEFVFVWGTRCAGGGRRFAGMFAKSRSAHRCPDALRA